MAFVDGGREMLAFTGEATLSLGRMLTGRARYRGVDLWLAVQETGANALPIVTLISVLVGMILAFVGAVQLREFGAGIYVADLVGLAMAREMGAMMTAIIMAGRTGAAFAAQIGTMRVNQEVDALTTLGFSPMDFLVLPRMLALAFMMPLLCIYADVLGILGGALVGVGMLDLTAALYWEQTVDALDLVDFAVGLVKATAFGVLVAMAGCLRGVQCGTSSASVGLAATSAVVTAIVAIIVTDAIFTVLFDVMGI
jgi:phospholipid/cholesterol/gamma-HCH transport system permease protein